LAHFKEIYNYNHVETLMGLYGPRKLENKRENT